MQIALYKGSGTLFDKIIRIVTRSKYSHCELVMDGICYSSSIRDGGVRMKAILLEEDKWDVLDIDGNRAKAVTWYLSNVNKKYDWLGAITSVLPITLNFKNKFFCSEALAYMLGLPTPQKQTPESIFKIYSK